MLLRPDTYCGTNMMTMDERWVLSEDHKKFVKQNVEVCPALYKIFDEVIVNACDHLVRNNAEVAEEPKLAKAEKRAVKQEKVLMDTMEVDINPAEGRISVKNNGTGLPVIKKYDVKDNDTGELGDFYIPEMIFGQLMTGSNYDDTEKRVTGGKNGLGAKLCNIFSKKFEVETLYWVQSKQQL